MMSDGLPSDGASSHGQPQGMLGYSGYKPAQFDSQGQVGSDFTVLSSRIAGDDGNGGIKSSQNYPDFSSGGPSQAYMGQGGAYMQASSRYFSGVGQGKPPPSINPAMHSLMSPGTTTQNSYQSNPHHQRGMRPNFSGQLGQTPQHAGSTPTLNHLLQSPNSLQQQRDSSSSVYSQDGSPKSESGPASSLQSSPYPIHHHQQGWGQSPRGSVPYTPYPSAAATSSMYRMQVKVAHLWSHSLGLCVSLFPTMSCFDDKSLPVLPSPHIGLCFGIVSPECMLKKLF